MLVDMEILEKRVEGKTFLDMLKDLRNGSEGEVSREMMLRYWNPDTPMDVSLMYLVNGNELVILPVPLEPKDQVDSFHIIKGIDTPINYEDVLKEFMAKTGYFSYINHCGIIVAKKGEDNSSVAFYSGAVVHESPFPDSPYKN